MASWAKQRQQITEAADGGARARTGADGATVLNLRRGLLLRADGQPGRGSTGNELGGNELGGAMTRHPAHLTEEQVAQEAVKSSLGDPAPSLEGIPQTDFIAPGRVLTLVRPGNDLVLQRIRNLKCCVQASGCNITTPRYACKMPRSCVSARRAKKPGKKGQEKRVPRPTNNNRPTTTNDDDRPTTTNDDDDRPTTTDRPTADTLAKCPTAAFLQGELKNQEKKGSPSNNNRPTTTDRRRPTTTNRRRPTTTTTDQPTTTDRPTDRRYACKMPRSCVSARRAKKNQEKKGSPTDQQQPTDDDQRRRLTDDDRRRPTDDDQRRGRPTNDDRPTDRPPIRLQNAPQLRFCNELKKQGKKGSR